MRPALAVVRRTISAVALGLVVVGRVPAQPPEVIPVPPDVKLVTPSADVPAHVARFAGAWGPGAWDGVLPHVLVVEWVDGADRAEVVYALGNFLDGKISLGYQRLTGRGDRDELTVRLQGGSVAYRFVGDSLHGAYSRGDRVSRVALTRAPLADVLRVSATAPGVVPGVTVRIPMKESGPGGDGHRLVDQVDLWTPAVDDFLRLGATDVRHPSHEASRGSILCRGRACVRRTRPLSQ